MNAIAGTRVFWNLEKLTAMLSRFNHRLVELKYISFSNRGTSCTATHKTAVFRHGSELLLVPGTERSITSTANKQEISSQTTFSPVFSSITAMAQ